MTKKQNKILTFLSIVVFFLAFLLSSRLYFRFDLSSNKAYTLSAQSKNLYKEIDDILRITYYVSDRLVSANPVPEEISGFLNEYAAHSKGKIQYIRKDPASANMLREMEYLGIVPWDFQVIERNEIQTTTVYSGIVIEYLDRAEVMPFVFSLSSLEYDVTSRIMLMTRNKDREIGIIIGDSSKYLQTDYTLLEQALTYAGYRIREIIPGEEIPDTLPVLFVLGGEDELDDWALYRIDRYIQLGGRVLFALDYLKLNPQLGLTIEPVIDQGLLAIVAAYGAAVLPALVMDNSSLNISFQLRENADLRTAPYPLWVAVQEQNGNPRHPITSRFNGLYLYWASPLEIAPPFGVMAEPLFISTPEAWLQTHDFDANPETLFSSDRHDEEETKGTRILGVALSGVFPAVFRDFQKPVREGYGAELPDLPLVSQPSRIIVVGDTDFASSYMEIGQGEARNLDFLIKAADWLNNDEDIISLRRGEIGRLDRITDENKRWSIMNFSRNFNVFVLPVMVIVFGIIFTSYRKKKTSGKNVNG